MEIVLYTRHGNWRFTPKETKLYGDYLKRTLWFYTINSNKSSSKNKITVYEALNFDSDIVNDINAPYLVGQNNLTKEFTVKGLPQNDSRYNSCHKNGTFLVENHTDNKFIEFLKVMHTLEDYTDDMFNNFKIVNIPDDVKYTIKQQGNCEIIVENHRVWK